MAGYFATLSLLKLDVSADGGSRFVGHYLLRTARRVLPSAVVVIAFTAGAALWLLPTSLWQSNIEHAVASLAFAENWMLIRTSTDYLQQDLQVPAFQQFWALGIQVQFYVLFAVWMLIVLRLGRRLGLPARVAAGLACGVVLVVSLAYSIYLTSVSQPTAYFSTFTRLWEFMGSSGSGVRSWGSPVMR